MKKGLKKTVMYMLVCIIFLIAIPINSSAASNPYPSSQTIGGVKTVPCTYYAWQQAYDNTGVAMPNFGNAKNWYTGAANAGYSVGTVAKPKSIAVWSGGTYGHVSYVVSVSGSKMTVNEGGMYDANGNAYNGNGILKGNTVNSIVGQTKGNGSTKVLVGFIYLTESVSSTAKVSFQVPDPDHSNTITNNNAILYAKVNKQSGLSVTKVGIKVRPDGGDYTTRWSLYHAPSQSYNGNTYMYPYYNLKEELGITLTHATKYYYRFYAVVGGVEYWSEEKSFTTTGSHSYGSWSTTKAATCTAAGSKTRKCTGCTKTETASISALGHNYSSSYTIDKAATCTAAGSKSKHCTRCSAKTSVTAIAATGHSYGAWSTTKAATCIAEGSKTRKCSVCSATDTQAISALGHNYSSSWTIDKSANCTVAGSKSHHCSRCNAKSSITTVSSLGHSWSEWTVTQEATVDSAGKKTRKCTRNGCSKTETVTIAKLAADGHTHTFGEWKTTAQETCTTDGSQQRICSICKQIEEQTISATGHTFSMWTIINEATVDSEGLAVRKCGVCEIKEEETIPKIVSDAQKNTSAKKTDNRGKWSLPLMLNILAAVIAVSGVVVAIILLKGKLVKKKK